MMHEGELTHRKGVGVKAPVWLAESNGQGTGCLHLRGKHAFGEETEITIIVNGPSKCLCGNLGIVNKKRG